MADSYRLVVLKRLTTLLEATAVTPISGVNLPATLANAVFRGRSTYGESDPGTMLSLLESPKPGDVAFGGYNNEARSEQWELLLQGYCPESIAHPSDNIYSLADDVERQLSRITASESSMGAPRYPTDYMLGSHPTIVGEYVITSFEHSPPIIRPPMEKVSSKCFFYMFLKVGLARIAD